MTNTVITASHNKKGARLVLMAALAVLVLGFGAVTSISAQTAHIDKKKSKKSVAVDSQTGGLREPTPAEARKLSEAAKGLLKPSKSPSVVQYSDGTLSMELTEEYLDFTVVKVNPDGTLSMECVKGPNAATALVGTTADSNASATKASAPSVKANNKVVDKKSSRAAVKRVTRKVTRKGVKR